MKNIAVFINPAFTDKQAIFSRLEALAAEHGVRFYGISAQRELLPKGFSLLDPAGQTAKKPDCILVFGGDGTILRAKDLALSSGAPLLGINLGWLGFLSETTLAELDNSIRDLIKGKYRLLPRMLVQCQLWRGGEIIFKGLALNDAVIHKADTPRLIRVRIFSGGRFVFDTRCDGVVASTPTGSTAYSLAAGGPILAPELRAIVLSPLNPHLLTIRPMVFSASDRILMRVHGLEEPAALQLDGENCSPLQDNDEVLITAAKQQVQFVKLSNRTFYQILRRKMHLGK
ncbi:MAG: NAD(+)/NADH kinase [Candidatus Cloacimonetes bacterium]|jgi:NAD+ kinase|nr:NAD(+)/NADH kinase [Candidatus Cloacimonadota bacterium]MDY0367042.1 NAD(+)/NADH kinase [Candidatus Syntrophosphaera sp.]HOY83989.1 NAD(+)/NADH kinase [Candidatus Syntrophosphaera sp.]HPH60042.1 NAD(+)/NADH kinase [Candidatus Syntrophosphaera sp.]